MTAVEFDFPLSITLIGILVCLFVDLKWLLRKPGRLPRLPYALAVALLVRLIPALIMARGASHEIDIRYR